MRWLKLFGDLDFIVFRVMPVLVVIDLASVIFLVIFELANGRL